MEFRIGFLLDLGSFFFVVLGMEAGTIFLLGSQ